MKNIVSDSIKSPDLIIEEMSKLFLEKSQESYNEEKVLYKKMNLQPPDNVEDFVKKKGNLSQVYTALERMAEFNNFINLLKSPSFYTKITTQVNDAKITPILSANKQKEELVSKEQFHKFIQQNIRLQGQGVNILKGFIGKLTEQLSDDQIEKKSLLNKIQTKNENGSIVEFITYSNPKSSNEINQLEIRRSKKGQLLWAEEDTDSLINFIEKQTGIELYQKKKNFYILQNSALMNETSQNIIDNLKTILESSQKKYKKSEPQIQKMINWIDDHKDKIGQILDKDSEYKKLLFEKKTLNKVKGDIGEFIIRTILELYFQDNDNENLLGENLGDQNFGTGQAAVDLCLKKMGFQIKNFPGQDFQPDIHLYHQINTIYSNQSSAGWTGKRYAAEKDWEILGEPFSKVLQNEGTINENAINKIVDECIVGIYKVLKNSFENYIRYAENIIDETKAKYKNLKNNFYIINFRVIPASFIFYRLYELSKQDSNNFNQRIIDPINYYYYYSLEKNEQNFKEKYTNLIDKEKNLNLIDSLKDTLKNFNKDKTVYFTFKGLLLTNAKNENINNLSVDNLVKI